MQQAHVKKASVKQKSQSQESVAQIKKIKAAITLAARSLHEMKARNDVLKRNMGVIRTQYQQLQTQVVAKDVRIQSQQEQLTKQHNEWEEQKIHWQQCLSDHSTQQNTTQKQSSIQQQQQHLRLGSSRQVIRRTRKRKHVHDEIMALPFAVPISTPAMLRNGIITLAAIVYSK